MRPNATRQTPLPLGDTPDDVLPALIQCPVCSHRFEKGRKTACACCPLNYGACHFERCPNCGYDIPQGSYLWDFMVKWKERILRKNRRTNDQL